MKKNIVQFVCFETSLDFEKFIPNWEHYAQKFESSEVKTNLLEQSNAKSKFRYISQHMAVKDEMNFTFMKDKRPVLLSENKIKVVQAGGYKPLQLQECNDKDASRVVLFLAKSVYDVQQFESLDYKALNIYEAYFESCNYSYILEFFVENNSSEALVAELKNMLHNPEVGVYKECAAVEN